MNNMNNRNNMNSPKINLHFNAKIFDLFLNFL